MLRKKARDFVYMDDLIRLIEKLIKVEAKSIYNLKKIKKLPANFLR